MRFCSVTSAIALSAAFAMPALASEKAEFSLTVSALKIARERSTIKPKEGESSSSSKTSADLFGADGESALPEIELALTVDRVVIYAYPNSAPGERELWLGLKATEQTEFGVTVGTNQLVFNPSYKEENNLKTSSSNKLGLFVNHRQEFDDLSFDFNLNPWYKMTSATFSDRANNEEISEMGFGAEALWVWDVADNLEVSSGPTFAWSKATTKKNGQESATSEALRIGITLAQTTYSF